MKGLSKLIIAIVVIVILVWGGFAIFGGEQEVTPETSDVSSDEPIKIGYIGPLTGEIASIGDGTLVLSEYALQEIREADMFDGREVEFIVEDDGCTSEGANAITKLVNVHEVDIIIGPACSPSAGPGTPIAQDAGVPTILTVASAPDLTATGDYIFRVYPSDAFQGSFAADFMYNDLGHRKVAVLYIKSEWGQGLHDVFTERFQELGGEIVYADSALTESTDVRTQITKIIDADPDAVYFPAFPQLGVVGVTQMAELGLEVPIVGGDAFNSEEFYATPEAEGIYLIQGQTPENADLLSRAEEAIGRPGHAFGAYYYDAMHIAADVIARVGTDGEAIRDALAGLKYEGGATAPIIEFDEQGDLVDAQMDLLIIQDGAPVPYEG